MQRHHSFSDEDAPIIVKSADGTSLAVWVEGKGPPLVMVHGSLQDHTASGVLVDELRNGVTTFSMDRRCFGESGDAPGYSSATTGRSEAVPQDRARRLIERFRRLDRKLTETLDWLDGLDEPGAPT